MARIFMTDLLKEAFLHLETPTERPIEVSTPLKPPKKKKPLRAKPPHPPPPVDETLNLGVAKDEQKLTSAMADDEVSRETGEQAPLRQ